ncbi:MAG: response regulator, partial [Deltaproteobacteria bacterium]|nr:response regulator [Deltaproteobacteria bacterium]
MGNSSQNQHETPTKILAIDDDPAILRLLGDYLTSRGYVVFQAEDGESGLELFARETPDLVLLDLRLPGMDGLEILSHLKEDFPDTPVIIVSGQGTIKDAIAALKTGAWDYITKPIFDLQVLHIAVKNVLERAKEIHEKDTHQ